MRAVHLTGLVLVAALATTPALAQVPSAADYVCKLTPEACTDGQGSADAQERDGNRGFSLALPTQAKAPVGQPNLARVRAAQRAPRAGYATSAQAQLAAGRARRPLPGVSRGDMMMTFLNGSADLTPQARANAAVLAKVMNTGLAASKRFVIEGHTNAVGTAARNYTLSQQRADALVTFLVGEGVDRSRLEAKGLGFDRPLPNRARTAAANRRVEARAIS